MTWVIVAGVASLTIYLIGYSNGSDDTVRDMKSNGSLDAMLANREAERRLREIAQRRIDE